MQSYKRRSSAAAFRDLLPGRRAVVLDDLEQKLKHKLGIRISSRDDLMLNFSERFPKGVCFKLIGCWRTRVVKLVPSLLDEEQVVIIYRVEDGKPRDYAVKVSHLSCVQAKRTKRSLDEENDQLLEEAAHPLVGELELAIA